jgi:RimJ/RimL family protein N-acetyltransferase
LGVETGRLTLEPLRVEHADEMVGVLAAPALYEFTGDEPPTLDELRMRYQRQVRGSSPDGSEEWLNWVIRERAGGRAIGFVQATLSGAQRDRADVAWVIGVEWQRRGYASEAAAALLDLLEARGVTAITAHIHPDNAASAGVAARVGLSATQAIEDGERVWLRSQA